MVRKDHESFYYLDMSDLDMVCHRRPQALLYLLGQTSVFEETVKNVAQP